MPYYKLDQSLREVKDVSEFFHHPDLILNMDSEPRTVNRILGTSLSQVAFIRIPAEDLPMSSRIIYTAHDNAAQCYYVDNILSIFRDNSSVRARAHYGITGSRGYYRVITEFRYDESLRIDKEGFYWKPQAAVRHKFASNYLKEQVRARYGFFDRPKSGKSNVILDSFFPGLLYKYGMDHNALNAEESFPKTSAVISPLIGDLMNIKVVPIDQLTRVLGYTTKDLTDLLKRVKQKNLNFIFAGAGGTGMNTSYWLNELSKMTNVINIFNSITVYEKEGIEFSNMLRFPLPLSAYSTSSVAHGTIRNWKPAVMAPLLNRLTTREPVLVNDYLEEGNNLDYTLFSQEYNNKTHKYVNARTLPNTFIYGAPGIEHRNFLSGLGNFICATHASTTCSVWLNPTQTETIEVESYGMIQLGGFFMNQLQMCISTMELLASDVDLNTKDHHYMDYEFLGDIKLKTDRSYQWQISQDLLMMTEEQANAI